MRRLTLTGSLIAALAITPLARCQTNVADLFAGSAAIISNTLSIATGEAVGAGSLAHGISTADGQFAIALGDGARAFHDRSFVWAGGATDVVESTQSGQFVIYAPGGIHLLGASITGNGAGLTSLVGSNLASGSISSAQLAAGSVLGSHLAANAVGTNSAAIAEWNGWGDGRFLNSSSSDTMTGALTISNALAAAQLTVFGTFRQNLSVGNIGIEGDGSPVYSAQTNSVWIGKEALRYSGAGDNNVAVGYLALQGSQGSCNSAIGSWALRLAVGSCNQAAGFYSGASVTGSYNSAFGWMSGYAAHGVGNAAFGHSTHEAAPGNYNTLMGFASSRFAPGDYNTAVGYWACYAATGHQNVAIGSAALSLSPSGRADRNVAIGASALGAAFNSDTNVAVGLAAGYAVAGGVHNVFLGPHAGRYDYGTRSVTNSVALGASAQVTANNTVVLGNTNHTVVIGGTCATNARFVVSPAGDLTVKGAVTLYVPAQGDLSMGSYTNGL